MNTCPPSLLHGVLACAGSMAGPAFSCQGASTLTLHGALTTETAAGHLDFILTAKLQGSRPKCVQLQTPNNKALLLLVCCSFIHSPNKCLRPTMCPDSTGTKQTQSWPSFGPYHTPQEWPITPISQTRTWWLRDARGFSQSHTAGLGTQLGSPLRCLMPPSPLPPAGLQVPNHGLARSPNRKRGAGGHPGRRVCKLARHGCGRRQERGHTGPREWAWRGQVPLFFQRFISCLTSQTAQHTSFCRPWGLFQLFISALPQRLCIWSCPFSKGPVNAGPPSRHCWVGQRPTAHVQSRSTAQFSRVCS